MLNVSECRKQKQKAQEAADAAAAAAQQRAAAAPALGSAVDRVARFVRRSLVPLCTPLFLALAVIVGIVVVATVGSPMIAKLDELDITSGYLKGLFVSVNQPTPDIRAQELSLPSALQLQAQVAEPTRIYVYTYPCMCCFRACSWTRRERTLSSWARRMRKLTSRRGSWARRGLPRPLCNN